MNISIEEMPREIERLSEENERLEQTINKAIEYIEDNIISYEDAIRDLRLNVSYPVEIGTNELGELLAILKGE